MVNVDRNFVLIHIATVPQSLFCFLYGQARYMRDHGADVHGVASPGELLQRFAEREGAVPHAIQMSRAISPFRDLVSLYQLCRILRQVSPDIVHAHTPKGAFLGMIAAFVMRVPIRIYHVHGLPHVTARGVKRFILKLTERTSCSLAHHVFCVSNSLREEVCRESFCPKSKVRVLVNGSINGVDAAERFNPVHYDSLALRKQIGIPSNSRVIGFVGRVVRDKGILELFEAWLGLRKNFPDLRLLLVGPFEEKDPIPDSVREKIHSDERIHVIGAVDDPAQFYAVMDILAFPTHREGFGLVAIEASAMRVPVVASCVPGCIDSVVDGKTGILVPPGDAEALSAALSQYLCDPELRRLHGENGRRRVLEKFLPVHIWEVLHGEYQNMLRTRGEI